MSVKKGYLVLLILVVVGAFMALSYSPTLAVERLVPDPDNHPPVCYPIHFFDEGYWGMECIDYDNNITWVVLETESSSKLIWDNTHVEMLVELNDNTTIYWQVCDSAGACVDGRYP